MLCSICFWDHHEPGDVILLFSATRKIRGLVSASSGRVQTQESFDVVEMGSIPLKILYHEFLDERHDVLHLYCERFC